MGLLNIEIYPTDPLRYIAADPGLNLQKGEYCIVTIPEVQEEAALVRHNFPDLDRDKLPENFKADFAPDISFLRTATDNDRQRIDANERLVEGALGECEQLVRQHNLEMRLVTAHFSFDGRGVMFVFTAESRVDFRALVKDLARHFKKRVRLKQIGPRDRARYIGQKYGVYGRCGRPLCCSTYLHELDSVTMDMVRVQNLENKGAAKLSGVCGKLMNCLAYEVTMYQEMRRELPSVGSAVQTPTGAGTVASFDILSQMVTVVHDNQTSEVVHLKDLQVQRSP